MGRCIWRWPLALARSGRAAQPLSQPAKLAFDPAGALVVDGQKVFPIALTIIPPPEAKAPNGQPAYAEFRDGGALFMRSGGPHWDEQVLESEVQRQASRRPVWDALLSLDGLGPVQYQAWRHPEGATASGHYCPAEGLARHGAVEGRR